MKLLLFKIPWPPNPQTQWGISALLVSLMHGFWGSEASVSGKVSGWKHQGVLMCRCRICQEYELWCNRNHLRGLWCFWNRVPERRGPGPRKENGAVDLCAAQSTGLRARGAGTLLLCCRCPTPTTHVGVAFLWLMRHVRPRRADFASVHAGKGTEKVSVSLHTR